MFQVSAATLALLVLSACHSAKSGQIENDVPIIPDSRNAAHCFAGLNTVMVEMLNKRAAFSPTTSKRLELQIRVQWEFDKLKLSQAKREHIIRLERQLGLDPKSAATLADHCSNAQDRDPAFHRARAALIAEVNAPPPPPSRSP